MTLIDYFNAFQAFSTVKNLSANARVLYYAILGEFNKHRYPDDLQLPNDYLLYLSGISSRSAFETARTSLINHKVIYHKRGHYQLGNIVKATANDTAIRYELPPRDNVVVMKIPKQAEPAKEPMFKDNGWVSAESQKTWFDCEKQEMNSATMQKLYPLEKMFGTKAVCDAILEASARNQRDKLTYNYVEKILQSQVKGESKRVNNTRNSGGLVDNSQYAGADY